MQSKQYDGQSKKGNEQYLTVGTFKQDYSRISFFLKTQKYKKLGDGDNNESSYIYIDNIELVTSETLQNKKPRFRE